MRSLDKKNWIFGERMLKRVLPKIRTQKDTHIVKPNMKTVILTEQPRDLAEQQDEY